jgi:hypothetical protein
MERQLGQVRLGVRGVESFERLAYPSVQLQTTAWRKVVVYGLANQRMGKAHSPRLAWHGGHDALARCLIEGVEEMITADLAYLLERFEIEFAPKNGRQDEDKLAILREVAEPLPDDSPHALGNSEMPARRIGDLFQRPFNFEQPDDLSDKERVAFSLLMDPVDDAR